MIDNRLVVDLWGGYRDLGHTKPWETDTLVWVASTSKVIVAIATLMVWDRGLIDLDEPVATYWPEFAQGGKAPITTRQVLVQRSGLPGFGRALTVDDAFDWDRVIGLVERAPVWYEPGTVTCYHASTFGYILGELVHRAPDVPLGSPDPATLNPGCEGPEWETFDNGMGGIKASAPDLAIFAQMFLNGGA